MAPQRREPGARAPAGPQLYYTDMPVAMLLIAGVCAIFTKYLDHEGCQAAAVGDGTLAQLPIYVPAGFPCGRPTLHQMAWFMAHPSTAFLLSADPMHRCWGFVAALLTPLIWFLGCIIVGDASPSASANYGIRLRSAFFPLLRIMPKAVTLAQLATQGPIHTVIHIYTERYQPIALLHVLITSIGSRYTGLLNLPVFLSLSLAELLISLAIRYLLSMHGHATWTLAHLTTNVFAYMGVPLLFAACISGWERRSLKQRRRLHAGDSCDMGGMRPAGQDGTGLGASVAAAAAKVEGREASAPSQCSAGSSGEASGASHEKQLQDQQQRRGHPVDVEALRGTTSWEGAGRVSSASAAAEGQVAVAAAPFPSLAFASASMTRYDGSVECAGVTPATGVTPASVCGGGDNRAAALTGQSLLAAAAAAVAANNRARGGDNGGAVPFDDPEKRASVILVRRILAQPVAEYQPMFTRQRVSIKVGPHSRSSGSVST